MQRDAEFTLAEQALHASERRYQQLFEQNLAGVFQATLNGIFLDCNDSFARMYGYSREELLSRRLLDLHPSADYEEMLSALRRKRSISNYDAQGIRKDGSTIWTLENIVLVRTQYEAIPYVQATVIDVTEGRQMREELKSAEAKFRHLVEQSLVGVFIVQEGRFTYVNPQFCEVSGYSAGELLAMTSILELVAPEDREYMRDLIVRRREGYFPSVYTCRITRKDGERRDVEVLGSRTSVDGRPAVIGTILDVTSRRRAEAERSALQESLTTAANEWRSTFDVIESPIVICDAAGCVVRLNRAARDVLGRSYDALIGRPLGELAHQEPWKKAMEVFGAIIEGREVRAGDATTGAGGRTWSIQAHLSSGRNADEMRVVIALQELTGVMRLQESLRRSEQMSAMGRLLAGVAHEVRNPLFGMTATLDAFEARFGSQPEYGRYFGAVRDQLSRLTDLMQDLLEYGKAATTQLSPGDIHTVISSAIAMCDTVAPRAKVEMVTRFADDIAPVMMESRRLVQVFRNLIENAIQHSPPRQAVTVSTVAIERDGRRWVRCAVDDSGPGFTAEDLPHVFDPFYSKRRGGTGLGLSIVQRVVEEHRGVVVASNRTEGGARMAVELPQEG
jgi:PAS domain S-box-containing protein